MKNQKSIIGNFFTLGVVTSAIFLSSGCGGGGSDAGGDGKILIQNAGSDTMVNLAQAWSEKYATIEPTVSVEVAGGGSGTGVAALINGTTDIATWWSNPLCSGDSSGPGRSSSACRLYISTARSHQS